MDTKESPLPLFPLPGPLADDIPLCEMHVFAWAATQPRNRVGLMNYLQSLGFETGKHRITEAQYETLRYALDHYHATAPHFGGVHKLADILKPATNETGFYVQGLPGRYVPSGELVQALQRAGWVYDVKPETTYFTVSERGVLWAKYQQIIGGRPLCQLVQE